MATHSVDPKTISTKVTLTKKSGPGELIGEIEKDVQNGEVDFSGIQFDTAGEYVILAIPSSPDLEQTEFTINVLPEEDVIEQDKEGDNLPEAEGDRPGITQIDKTRIELKPMEYDASDSDDVNKNLTSHIGLVPFFWYNGIQIQERDILSMTLTSPSIYPTLDITFNDSSDIIKNNPPLNDTKVELFLNSGSESLKSIHLKFKIMDIKRKSNGKYQLLGVLDLNNFYRVKFKSYTGTSFEVLRNVSSELKLGFNSNIKNTNDSMSWKNTGLIYNKFISEELIPHAWISENSFMLGYIDYYWCFNYVDIEKEWNRDVSNDVGVNSQGMSKLDKESGDGEKILDLILTNDPAFNNSNLFMSSISITNNSTHQSLTKGNLTKITYYDTFTKSILTFNIDALSTNDDKVMSLKGGATDTDDFKNNFKTKYLGRFDSRNVHINYKYAEEQNKRNLQNLVNIVADVSLAQPNFNLYKYQKIRLNIINERQTVADPNFKDERHSGEWMIIDISFNWNGSRLMQNMKLVRKELNKKPEELNATTEPDKTVNNSEVNENPSDALENPPNGVYAEGEVYTVRGSKDGKLYQLTIEKLSENGKEVVAKIKEL